MQDASYWVAKETPRHPHPGASAGGWRQGTGTRGFPASYKTGVEDLYRIKGDLYITETGRVG